MKSSFFQNTKIFYRFLPWNVCKLGTCDLFWLFSRGLYSCECISYLVWMNIQSRNLTNFFGGILENQWFHKYILTSSDLYNKAEFYKKYRYIFLQKAETLFMYSSKLCIKFDPIVGNCVLYISVYLQVEVLVLKKSSDQWQPYLMSQTWQLNKKGKAC